MALVKRGARRVVVDDKVYRWTIRRKPTHMEGAFSTPMHVAIEAAEPAGVCALHVNLGVSRPDNWISPHETSVTPRMVRMMIREALAAGWQPDVAGSAYTLHHPIIRDA